VVEVAGEPDRSTCRLSLSGHRALCDAREKPFGALVELANRALPPAEAAYMAIANGANHLRVAQNPRFLFWQRQPPLEVALGRAFERIRRAGPLLACSKRPPARLALVFPFTQTEILGSAGLLAAHELLHAAFGEADLLHERLATGDRLRAYPAVAILGTRLLRKKTADALVEYAQRGGLLLADRADTVDENDAPLPWPQGFFGEAETPIFEAIACRRRAYGAGHTMLFSADITVAHQSAVERNDVVAARALRRAVAAALAERRVRPRAWCDNPNVEVGLRACEGTRLVVAVNHSDEPQDTRIELDAEGGPIACAYDLSTGDEQPLEQGEAPALAARLAPRDGAIWALYPERPFTLRLELPDASPYPGGELRYRVLVVNESGTPVGGRHIVRIFATDPSGQERPDLGGERVTENGVLEVGEPLAVNELPGSWTICVTDLLTRRVVRRTFEMADERHGETSSSPEPPNSREER